MIGRVLRPWFTTFRLVRLCTRASLPPWQAKSNGLLEMTVMISGEYRKRNIPGAAFRRGAGKLLANARNLVSPVPSSPAESVRAAVSSLRWVVGCWRAACLLTPEM